MEHSDLKISSTKREKSGKLIYRTMDFLRHKQESLNNVRGMGKLKFQVACPVEHYSMLPASGYPLAGCSPAEPASVFPIEPS